MNAEVQIDDARRGSTWTACPEKSNPNRPAAAAGGPCREIRGESRSFPERSNPRRPRQALDDRQQELVTRYMPMAEALARQAQGSTVSGEELTAEAYAALVEAATAFDPDRGVSFAQYARPRIVGALRDYRRFLFHANWKGGSAESPVFERLGVSDEIHGRVLGKEPEDAPGRDGEIADAVAAVVRRLPRSESDACRLIDLEGKSYEEAAALLGCTKGYLSRLRSVAIDRLRSEFREALVG